MVYILPLDLEICEYVLGVRHQMSQTRQMGAYLKRLRVNCHPKLTSRIRVISRRNLPLFIQNRVIREHEGVPSAHFLTTATKMGRDVGSRKGRGGNRCGQGKGCANHYDRRKEMQVIQINKTRAKSRVQTGMLIYRRSFLLYTLHEKL